MDTQISQKDKNNNGSESGKSPSIPSTYFNTYYLTENKVSKSKPTEGHFNMDTQIPQEDEDDGSASGKYPNIPSSYINTHTESCFRIC